MQATTAPGSNSQTLYRNLGANGSSSNVFAASEPFADKSSSPVGTNYILHVRGCVVVFSRACFIGSMRCTFVLWCASARVDNTYFGRPSCVHMLSMQLMTSEEAWQLSTTRNSSPVDVAFCEDLVLELSDYVSRIPPEVRSAEKLGLFYHVPSTSNPHEASGATLAVCGGGNKVEISVSQ